MPEYRRASSESVGTVIPFPGAQPEEACQWIRTSPSAALEADSTDPDDEDVTEPDDDVESADDEEDDEFEDEAEDEDGEEEADDTAGDEGIDN
jgi:hypothetical protein